MPAIANLFGGVCVAVCLCGRASVLFFSLCVFFSSVEGQEVFLLLLSSAALKHDSYQEGGECVSTLPSSPRFH